MHELKVIVHETRPFLLQALGLLLGCVAAVGGGILWAPDGLYTTGPWAWVFGGGSILVFGLAALGAEIAFQRRDRRRAARRAQQCAAAWARRDERESQAFWDEWDRRHRPGFRRTDGDD